MSLLVRVSSRVTNSLSGGGAGAGGGSVVVARASTLGWT